jgi:hypothetical protein
MGSFEQGKGLLFVCGVQCSSPSEPGTSAAYFATEMMGWHYCKLSAHQWLLTPKAFVFHE